MSSLKDNRTCSLLDQYLSYLTILREQKKPSEKLTNRIS